MRIGRTPSRHVAWNDFQRGDMGESVEAPADVLMSESGFALPRPVDPTIWVFEPGF